MSVRLNAKCPHDSSSYQRASCGHCYCPTCKGHVSPITKVVLGSASNIVTCNRKPVKDYDIDFEIVGSGEYASPLAEKMQGIKARVKESPAEIIRMADENFQWQNYERLKGRAKRREAFHCHYAIPVYARTTPLTKKQYTPQGLL